MGKRAFSAMIALVLALGLLPASALADGLTAQGEIQKNVSPQASKSGKVQVWVLAATPSSRTKFSYNAKGQLVKVSSNFENLTLTYKKDRIVAYKNTSSSGTLSYDKKGRLSKTVQKGAGGYTTTWKYAYDKKGRVSRVTEAFKVPKNAGGATQTTVDNYAYSKDGRVSSATETLNGASTANKFFYDKRGNIKKLIQSKSTLRYTSTFTFKSTYGKSGLLTKRMRTVDRSPDPMRAPSVFTATTKFKFKKVNVPRKYASQVEVQQRELLNDDYYSVYSCFALPRAVRSARG